MESKFKRKIVLINKKKQFTVLGYFAFLAVLPILISYCTVRIGMNQLLVQMVSGNYFSSFTVQSFLEKQIEFYSWQTLILVILVVSTFILAGVYLTHRIFGPIYHLRLYMRKVMEGGDTREIHFRKGDFFKDLEKDFNAFQEHLKK